MIIYNSLILFHLNYCILVWGYRCERITKLQKRIVRILSLSKYNSHTDPIFKTLKLLKVYDIIKLQELKFYYKYENNLLPHYLQCLPFQLNTNSHRTRSQNKNVQWRSLIKFIVIVYKQGLTGYVKQSLLQFYQQSCTILNCYICSRS